MKVILCNLVGAILRRWHRLTVHNWSQQAYEASKLLKDMVWLWSGKDQTFLCAWYICLTEWLLVLVFVFQKLLTADVPFKKYILIHRHPRGHAHMLFCSSTFKLQNLFLKFSNRIKTDFLVMAWMLTNYPVFFWCTVIIFMKTKYFCCFFVIFGKYYLIDWLLLLQVN